MAIFEFKEYDYLDNGKDDTYRKNKYADHHYPFNDLEYHDNRLD